MRYLKLFLVVAVMCIFFSSTYADIPRAINFQGRLTDASGKFVPDGEYVLQFRIWTDSVAGTDKWVEDQLVGVNRGLFNVILGKFIPIPDSIFDNPDLWLGIKVGADPEMTPRQRLTSLGYSYHSNKADTSSYSSNSDKLDGFHATDFSSVGTDYGRSGVATDLYEGTTTLTNKYVNTQGPDSVYSTTGSAFLGKTSVGSTSFLYGVKGYAENTSSGNAYGGLFETSLSGTGAHTGVFGYGASNSSPVTYGHYGLAYNASSGNAYGGYFETSDSGTGIHFGVSAHSYGRGNAVTVGSDAYAVNYSTGSTYGFYGIANNTSTGTAYGGYFGTSSAGTGEHYGVYAEAAGASLYSTYGCYGYGYNTSMGDTYGGYFVADYSGTGSHYGVVAQGSGNTSRGVFGLYSTSQNFSDGDAYAGSFYTPSFGTGKHYGIKAISVGSSDSSTYGVSGYGSNSSTGDVYGGFFETSTSGTANHYGLSAEGKGNSPYQTYGVYGEAENTSSGYTYAGYFSAPNVGTGIKYGLYAEAPTSGWAGYFFGDAGVSNNMYVSGNQYVAGTKSAAVKVENGEYRAMYSQESPENWFEDFGEAQLINGKTHIELDHLFLETVTIDNLHPMKVFVQLEGDCNGIFVTKGITGFDVTELKGGVSNVTFSYRVVAKRKGYESIRLAKIAAKTPEMMASEQAKRRAESEQERARIKQGRIERTEEEMQQYRPKSPEMESLQKVRKEEPRPDTEKMRVVSQER